MSSPTDVPACTAEARYIPDPVPAGPAIADPGPLGLAAFAALTLTFLFLFLGEATAKASATGLDGLTKFGGWLGLLTAVLAWYASFAGVTNSTWKRTLLPTWPRA
jgi:succinate-acetate transporter protein